VLAFIAPDKKEHGEKIYDMIETDPPSVAPIYASGGMGE
jgi:hypothetical protein